MKQEIAIAILSQAQATLRTAPSSVKQLVVPFELNTMAEEFEETEYLEEEDDVAEGEAGDFLLLKVIVYV